MEIGKVSIDKMSKTQTEIAAKETAVPPQSSRSRVALKWPWLVGGLVVLALVVYPLINQTDTFGINLLTQILIAAIFALSYDLIFGYTGLLSFGQASYYGLGAFGAGLMVAKFNISNFWLSLLVA